MIYSHANHINIKCPNCGRHKAIKATGKAKHKNKNMNDFISAPRRLGLGDKVLYVQVICSGCKHIWYSKRSEAILAYSTLKIKKK